MKKISTLFCCIALITSIYAQNGAKKYPLFETFSNSHSQLMASKNPTFYVLLDKYANDIRHITYYAPFPTDSCIMYKDNKADFDARVAAYRVSVTPWVMRDAGLLGLPLGKDLVVEQSVTSSLGKISPIEIKVVESGTGDRTAAITIKTIGTKPTGNYKLNVAVIEKTVNRLTTNGEMEHRNVFRAMLPSIKGDSIVLADTGGEITRTYNIKLNNAWNPNEIYILAFVQPVTNGTILNSGTRFDGVSSNNELLDESTIEIVPNPVGNQLHLIWNSEVKPESVSIYAMDGTTLYNGNYSDQLDVQNYKSGMYIIHIEAGKYGAIKTFVKY